MKLRLTVDVFQARWLMKSPIGPSVNKIVVEGIVKKIQDYRHSVKNHTKASQWALVEISGPVVQDVVWISTGAQLAWLPVII